MPIGLAFRKATAEKFIADLAEGRPLGIIDVGSWDVLVLAGVLFDVALVKMAEVNDPDDGPPVSPGIDRYLSSRQIGATIEYSAILAGLVMTGRYDRVCEPVVRVSVSADREVTAIDGFHEDPPEFFHPTQNLLSLADDTWPIIPQPAPPD
jgi:hypothetical protein